MTIQGQVTDYKTGEPLPAASVIIYDKNGVNTGQGTSAAADGTYVLTSDLLGTLTNRVCFSFVGYADLRVPPDQADGEMALVKKGDLLGEVVVTGKRMAKSGTLVPALIFIAIAIIVVWLAIKYKALQNWSVNNVKIPV